MTSAILVPGEVDIKGDFGKGKHKINDSNIGSKKNFGPKIILGPNNFRSQNFLTPKQLGPESLVKIGSDIAYMDKCHPDVCHLVKMFPET